MGYEIVAEEVETVSGRLHRRPGMDRIMKMARGHHIHAVAVVKLDRWGRSLQNLVTTVRELLDNHVEFHAIDQGINLNQKEPTSMFTFNIMCAMAEFEADMISARTREGMAAKRAAGTLKGPIGGRPIPCWACGRLSMKKKVKRRGGTRVRVCADRQECHTKGFPFPSEGMEGFSSCQVNVPSNDGGA
jgi:DNA invertase Pin-like site-specific DNA recombinase